MDEKQILVLLTAAPAAAAVNHAAALAKDLGQRLFGPTCDAVGEAMAQAVKRCVDRRDEMIRDANSRAIQPDLKTIKAIVNGVAVEEDDSMQERFAALLANASLPQSSVLPAFPSILSDLSPAQARLLDDLVGPSLLEWPSSPAGLTCENYARTADGFEVMLEDLSRRQLVRQVQEGVWSKGRQALIKSASGESFHVIVTNMGTAFVKACRPPALELEL